MPLHVFTNETRPGFSQNPSYFSLADMNNVFLAEEKSSTSNETLGLCRQFESLNKPADVKVT